MGEKEKLSFGKYVEQLRRSREKSLRETGKAIGVKPQFYSEVEKGRRNAFTKDRMEKLVAFLFLNEEETRMLYVKAKEANNVPFLWIVKTMQRIMPLSWRDFGCLRRQVQEKRMAGASQ